MCVCAHMCAHKLVSFLLFFFLQLSGFSLTSQRDLHMLKKPHTQRSLLLDVLQKDVNVKLVEQQQQHVTLCLSFLSQAHENEENKSIKAYKTAYLYTV